jgi:hypothetical protein
MFQIYYDGKLIYDPRAEESAIEEGSCHLAMNEAGSLTCVLPPGHPAYATLQPRKGIVELRADSLPIYRGRVISTSKDFYLSQTVETEGLLACLNDSVIPPHTFPADWEKDKGYLAAENVVEFYLTWLLDQHNSQVTEEQQLKLGKVTVCDSNNYIYRASENYATTWDTVKDKLFGSALGGDLVVRYEADGTYVDYLEEPLLTNVQHITFGENLLNLTDEMDTAEVCSAILPLGADGLTIESLADGSITKDLVKDGKLIYSISAREKYGNVTQIVTWDEVTEAANLKTKAAAQLAQAGVKLVETITATAVDLGLTSEDVQQLRVGRNTILSSPPHGLAATYPLSELDLELLAPENTKITLGKTAYTISSQINQSFQGIQDQVEAVKAAAVAAVTEEYYLSTSQTALEGGEWVALPPDWTEGHYLWSRTKTTTTSGTVTYGEAKCLAGATGQAGEDATVLRIDSSRGTVFKNNSVSTVLSAVIYHGSQRITDLATLQAVFGSGAYLEWSWQRMDEDRFGVISASDSRLGENGFTFTLSPEDVDTKVTFQCNLIV